MTDTKTRILRAALELFALRGPDGVSMDDIASAVGVKAPSLYKYYSGKAALYQGCLDHAEARYGALWDAVAQGHDRLCADLPRLGTLLEPEQLEAETAAWVDRELQDADGPLCRKLLTTLQLREGARAGRCLWETPVERYESFFARLIDQGILRRGDPHVMAVEYLAPVFQLLARQDRQPQLAESCREELRRHIRQFHRVFAVRERPTPPQNRIFRR